MATWKKVIVSGSEAHLLNVTASNLTQDNLVITGAGGALENSSITLNTGVLDIGNNSIQSTGETSILSGSFSGSFQGDGSNLTGIPTTLTFAGETGTGTIDLQDQTLTITAGEGIDTDASGQVITISGEDASDTNKGIASFNSTNFTVTAGAVTSNNITINSGNGLTDGGSLTLGGSTTLNIGAGTGITVNSNDIQLKNASALTANTITKWDNINGQLTNSILTDDGSTATVGGNLTVSGNLAIQGNTTTVNTANLLVEDKFILLNSGSANPDEGGLVIDEGAGNGHAFIYESDAGKQRWGFNQSVDSTASTADSTAFAAAVVDTDGAGHTDTAEYQKNGNIKIEGGDIWIYG